MNSQLIPKTLLEQHNYNANFSVNYGIEVSAKTKLPDISWYNCTGKLMAETNWHDTQVKCFDMLLAETRASNLFDNSHDNSYENSHENLLDHSCDKQDDALLIIFNAHSYEVNYQLPCLHGYWQRLIDTTNESIDIGTNLTNSLTDNTNIIKPCLIIKSHSCIVLSFKQNNTQTALSQTTLSQTILPQITLPQTKSIEN